MYQMIMIDAIYVIITNYYLNYMHILYPHIPFIELGSSAG